MRPIDWLRMSAEAWRFERLAPLKSAWWKRAVTLAPERFAPVKRLASSGRMSRPSETTRVSSTAPERSAREKSAAITQAKLGRASCRERVCQYVKISVVAGTLKKNNKNQV